MSVRNIVIAVVVILVLVAGWFYVKLRGVREQAVKWEGSVPDLIAEDIQKERDLTRINLSSRIDAPPAEVFDSFEHPERAEGAVDQIKMAKVISGDDSKKQVEFHVTTLGQLQVFTVELTYDKAGNAIGIKTVE